MSHNLTLWIGANLLSVIATSLTLGWSVEWWLSTRRVLPLLTGLPLAMARRNMTVAAGQAVIALGVLLLGLAMIALGVLLLGLAMIAVAVLRHTQRVADYVANGTAAFTVIWLYECIGVWWDRRTMQRLMRLDQRAELRLVEREERTG